MRKSYRNMLVFQLIIIFILILNSFVSSILTGYNMALLLFCLLILFKIFFGFERTGQRYIKDIIVEEIIFLLLFFIIYYLLGIYLGFARTGNYYTWENLNRFIFPNILFVILKEFLRYFMLTKSEGSKSLTIITCLIFIFFDITNAIYFNRFASGYDSFIFLALTFFPAVSTNIVCSYISFKTGYKTTIFYLLVMTLYQYLLPIIPNPNEYIASVVNLVVPALLGYRIYTFFSRENDEQISRNYNKSRAIILLIPTFAIIAIVYLTSGYFHYYAIAIASGSMSPKILKGDAVIIEKIDGNYESLEVGQVIAFRHDGIIVVHRLINIIEDNDRYYFYTKGDANSQPDGYAIEQEMVIGIVNMKIPYVGLPTVWLNEGGN